MEAYISYHALVEPAANFVFSADLPEKIARLRGHQEFESELMAFLQTTACGQDLKSLGTTIIIDGPRKANSARIVTKAEQVQLQFLSTAGPIASTLKGYGIIVVYPAAGVISKIVSRLYPLVGIAQNLGPRVGVERVFPPEVMKMAGEKPTALQSSILSRGLEQTDCLMVGVMGIY